ncbi:MAG TPA: META domain-containing protein, partial [Anaerolineae bacterium]|nr:META domain-containing protein [Anaerolineae bacterium]
MMNCRFDWAVAGLLVTAVFLVACQTIAPEATVTGVVTLPPGEPLPENVVVKVQLLDVSQADTTAVVLGEQIIENPVKQPIPFTVTYKAGDIEPNGRYQINVRLVNDLNQLLYINSAAYLVLTQGNGARDMAVLAEAVGGTAVVEPPPAPTPTALLPTAVPPTVTATAVPTPAPTVNPNLPTAPGDGFVFRLTAFGPQGGQKDVLAGTEITARFVGNQIVGTAGCNQYAGFIVPVNDYFNINGLSVTEMACVEPPGIMEQERDYLSSLIGVSGYQFAWQANDQSQIIGLELYYPLANGGVGVLTYVT